MIAVFRAPALDLIPLGQPAGRRGHWWFIPVWLVIAFAPWVGIVALVRWLW
jgi:hypothetical protein